ncbi:hypothetical protein H5410_064074 [Solanum commersonii]|uniref:Uncharacterized protein n=1 Tax=Solanum commersonii TaxID=4109 RepID=A0A9J5W0N0_SOLCO|nr:hypothetical protein H5410_064074 [Solanum commersonii]
MEFLVIPNSDLSFAKILLGHLFDLTYGNFDLNFAKILPGRPLVPYLWNKLAFTAKTDHFQGQTIPEASKPLFC